MNNYVIITDSGCDIAADVLAKWGVEVLDLTFRFEDDNVEKVGSDMPVAEFYQKMRDGGVAKTAAINPSAFEKAFEENLKNGKDVIYIGFSSGLSTTYNSSCIAAEELREKYPERKIIMIDTLCASAGQGLCVYLASKKKESGASIDELAEYIEGIKMNICHWFTVEDLVYLKRGGRVSPTVAFVGSLLGIKPIMHVDNNGKLVSVTKIKGRKASLSALANKYGELRDTIKSKTVFISHADSLDAANYLKDLIKKRFDAVVELITDISPIIGAHSGPGTMALFFVGKER